MISKTSQRFALIVVACLTSGALLAADDIPLRPGPPPSMAEAARIINASRSRSGNVLTPETHIVNPPALIFQTIAPCRLVDTRNSSNFYGGPIFANGETRVYQPSQPPAVTCNSFFSSLPANVLAWYTNITVTGTTGGPSHLTAWQDGLAIPTIASVNWPSAGASVNNSVIVPAAANTAFDVFVGSSAHVIIDITGLFIDDLSDRGDQLAIITNRAGQAAILGQNNSSADGSHAIGGFEGGSGIVHGVQGQISAAAAAGSSGVHGIGAATAGKTSGVLGESNYAFNDSAGVLGRDSHGALNYNNLSPSAGVRGEGNNGVVGVSDNLYGVMGAKIAAGPTLEGFGVLGYNSGAAQYGAFAFGVLGATGAKLFVEPHPTDASKVIRYVALEGNESGTYCRGTARIMGGTAVIQVPESFKIVTDEAGLTIQVTPVGAPAMVWVESQDLNTIVVRSAKDVTFHYLVQGVRRAYKDWQVIAEGQEFMPRSANEPIPNYLPEEAKRRLIQNGTYHADGSVNLETAKALGWDKVWEKPERPVEPKQ